MCAEFSSRHGDYDDSLFYRRTAYLSGGIALVMGENSRYHRNFNVAALTANTQARRAAMAHMVFNIFGVLWILCVFRPFIHLVCGWVGYDDMMEKTDPHFVANAARLSFVLAAFHTTFNLSNTIILVWVLSHR